MTISVSSRGQVRYDLALMARAAGRRKSLTLRPIVPTAVMSNDLAAIYLLVVRAWRNAAAELVLPAYEAALSNLVKDEEADRVTAALNGAEANAYRVSAGLSENLRRWTVRVEKWHRGKFTAGVEAASDLKVAGVVMEADATESLALAIERNASLIRSISEESRQRISQSVWQGLTNKAPRREIARQISEAVGMERDRALRVAVDQTNKLSGDLDQLRQTQAGISEYIWIHSGKVHFRPVHKARNGKRFSWDKPPADGHPKTLPFCGCSAQPFVNVEG